MGSLLRISWQLFLANIVAAKKFIRQAEEKVFFTLFLYITPFP